MQNGQSNNDLTLEELSEQQKHFDKMYTQGIIDWMA